MTILDAIADKRDGRRNSPDQLRLVAQGAADGSVPDYQLSAWLMAAYLNGLDATETAGLTLAMAQSGRRLDLTGLPKPWVDKHSTGGVGDKTTLVVLPILAACGLTMVKMSGRGLGITGGTIDKLESVPGFRTDLTASEMVDQARRIGIALSGQTPELAPADKALYSLRDVTGTVASVPLITASILSKKIAGGAEAVMLDVKCGRGAFMKSLDEAVTLARSLIEVGTASGLRVGATVTDMDQPLGRQVGNALEVREALETLWDHRLPGDDDGGSARLTELCLHMAGHALESVEAGTRRDAESAFLSGRAFEKAREWFAAQGGDVDAFLSARHDAPVTVAVPNPSEGFVKSVDALAVGEAALALGAGRMEVGDEIDHRVGVTVRFCVGQHIDAGDPVFLVHARDDDSAADAALRLQDAVVIVKEHVEPRPVVVQDLDGSAPYDRT